MPAVLTHTHVCALSVRCHSDAMRRKGKAPRDHARDNIRAMRAQQAQNRAMRDEAKNQQPGFKMKRFQHVKARVDRSGVRAAPSHSGAWKQQPRTWPNHPLALPPSTCCCQVPKEEATGASPPQQRKRFLRKGSKLGPECLPKPKPFQRDGPRKPTVPKATETTMLVRGDLWCRPRCLLLVCLRQAHCRCQLCSAGAPTSVLRPRDHKRTTWTPTHGKSSTPALQRARSASQTPSTASSGTSRLTCRSARLGGRRRRRTASPVHQTPTARQA